MKRILSIDVMRGIVMIIMALDHTRDLIHANSVTQLPTNLDTTSPALFLTRLITHLCAPTFVFLSGVSAFLSAKRQGIAASRRFLISRGIWLIIVEFTLVNFGLWFDIHFKIWLFDVIATIGFGFIVLGLLMSASIRTIAIIGLAVIFLHNLVPLGPGQTPSLFTKIIMPFFLPSVYPLGGNSMFIMGYPPIPWLGIMLTGFAAGKLFELPAERRKFFFLRIGLMALALFVIIRFVNIYGDPRLWSDQKTGLFTFFSFLNVTKYPPSLLFTLSTLGVMFICLFFLEGIQNRITRIAEIYGKVPLFYFIIHWYIIHPIMFLIVFLQGYKSSDLVFGTQFGRPNGVSGVNLIYIYLIWIAVLILLYPLCIWYGNYKLGHRHKKWLRYI